MKNDDKTTPSHDSQIMHCEEIQKVLFDYMNRELGVARSDLVREHLRKCGQCQKVAGQINDTIDLLRDASVELRTTSPRLSDERRARVIRSFSHPLISWIERHHILFSTIISFLVILALVLGLRRVKAWQTDRLEGVPVTIGVGDPENSLPGVNGNNE